MMERNKLLILSRNPTRYAELIKRFDFTDLELVAFDSVEKAKKYAENYRRFLDKKPLLHIVNFSRGY